MKRRTFLKGSLAAGATVGSGLLASNMAFAGSAAAETKAEGADPYAATSVEDALKALGITAEDSDKITVNAPDLAENAAVVPLK